MASNTAIFYDIENLLGVFNEKTNTGLHLDEIYRQVLETEGVTGVSIQRAYADWAMPMHRNLKNLILQIGIEPIQIFNTNQNDRVKNAADVCLIIDAVDLAARNPNIENFVIASGDGIFAFLSKKLHEHGKRVIGCSFEKIANAIFMNSCDKFIGLEKDKKNVIAKTITKKAPKVPKKQTTKLPKTKYTETLLNTNIEALTDLGDTASVMHIVRQLVEALFTEDTKDLPGLEISVFVNYINHYIPGFKVKQHGFKRIGEFMQFVLTGSPYCTYTVEDNVVLMAQRKAAETANGKIVKDIEGLLLVTPEGERYNTVFNVPFGVPFVYTTQAQTPVQEVRPEGKESTVRKLIKSQFEELAGANVLSENEVGLLTTAEYAKTTFGVRAPILQEVDGGHGRSIKELRTVGGRVKYWREPFDFNGKKYLVYKEWANLHKNRFMVWYDAQKSKT